MYNELDYRWHPIKPTRKGKYQLQVYHNGEWLFVSILARTDRPLKTVEIAWVQTKLEDMVGQVYTFNKLTHVAYSIKRVEVQSARA